MGLPGSPANLIPAGEDWIPRKLRDIERSITELAAVNWIKTFLDKANLAVETGVLRVLGALVVDGTLNTTGDFTSTGSADITGTTHIGGATDIDGTLNVDAATTIGGTLGVTGNATFGGAMAITGTLSLPAGIIDNDALANPIVPAAFTNTGTGFAVANTYQTKASVTLTTPAGFTKALVTASAHIRVLNTSAGAATYAMVASINGTAGPMVSATTPAGLYGNVAVGYASLVTGLTDGATFVVATRMYSTPALTADVTNEATANGTVLWLR